MVTLKEIYMALSDQTPNAYPGFDPASVPGYAKQVDDMKKLMSKDVTELASGFNEPFAYDIVFVRGRRMVIPKAHASRMINATLFSCLYALEDSRIDKILAGVNAQAHFLTPDGEVVIQRLILVDVPAPHVPTQKPPAVQAVEPTRHIFLDDDDAPKAFEQKPGQMVAVLVDNAPAMVGTIWAWNTRPSPDVHHIVRIIGGADVECPESRLIKIDSMEEVLALCSKPKQQ